MKSSDIQRQGELLDRASQKGSLAKLGAWFRLSGPGWLQSAITLGGGSLVGALYLGALGGYSFLWLQIVAIGLGIVMLGSISYVTLSTGIRPFPALNQYVNPVLGIGWVLATILANMIFILPQFSLCFDTFDNNLFPSVVDGNNVWHKAVVSGLLGTVAFLAVWMDVRGGRAGKLFDLGLKLIVGMIVVCFAGVVLWLILDGKLDWKAILGGLVPDFSSWNNPAPAIASSLAGIPEELREFWTERILNSQRAVMISTTATAVGINMTFLLPYSLLSRGWDRRFRGLAIFDLLVALAIPFVIVTSCIVISSAFAFHGRVDGKFLSSDPATVASSRIFGGALDGLEARFRLTDPATFEDLDKLPRLKPDEQVRFTEASRELLSRLASTMTAEEKQVATAFSRPNSGQLAEALGPIFRNPDTASRIFGLGAFGMGFSTIIILMLINGYAIGEILGDCNNRRIRVLGALLAGGAGFSWIWLWTAGSKTWLVMVASAFAGILLPIAYFSFFLLANNQRLLGKDMVRGGKRVLWNFFMLLAVAGAVAQSAMAISEHRKSPLTYYFILGGVSVFILLMLAGFAVPKDKARQGGRERETT
jgi:Mn2+/Fe2+ NRAMP family transporter